MEIKKDGIEKLMMQIRMAVWVAVKLQIVNNLLLSVDLLLKIGRWKSIKKHDTLFPLKSLLQSYDTISYSYCFQNKIAVTTVRMIEWQSWTLNEKT